MTSESLYEIKKIGKSTILYDSEIIATPAVMLFNPDSHSAAGSQQAASQQAGIGRAKVVYFEQQDIHNKRVKMVLKHYFRGGMVATIVKDRYAGTDVDKTRAFREFRLLKKMQSLGLPVPVAIAAHAEQGLFYFRADLITEEITDVKTLAELLSEKVAEVSLWKKMGGCIRLFHDKGVYHADLNARNILLTENEDVYLIDFDNSYIRNGLVTWKAANLSRLKRSLLKFKGNTENFNFTDADWQALLHGYG